MAIQCGGRQFSTELMLQDLVDDVCTATRLFAFQLDGPRQNLRSLALSMRLAPIAAPLALSGLDTSLTQPLPPTAQRALGDLLARPVGQQLLLLAEHAKIRSPLAG